MSVLEAPVTTNRQFDINMQAMMRAFNCVLIEMLYYTDGYSCYLVTDPPYHEILLHNLYFQFFVKLTCMLYLIFL